MAFDLSRVVELPTVLTGNLLMKILAMPLLIINIIGIVAVRAASDIPAAIPKMQLIPIQGQMSLTVFTVLHSSLNLV